MARNRKENERPKSPIQLIITLLNGVFFVFALFNDCVKYTFILLSLLLVISLLLIIFKGWSSKILAKRKWFTNQEQAKEWIEDFSVIQMSSFFIFILVFIGFVFPKKREYPYPKIKDVVESIIENQVSTLLPTIENITLEKIETEIVPIVERKVETLIPTTQNSIISTSTPLPEGFDATQVGDKFIGEFLFLLNNRQYKDNEILLPYFCEGDGEFSAYSRFVSFFSEKYIMKYPDTHKDDFDTSFSCDRDIINNSINDRGMYWEFELKLQCSVSYEGGNFAEEDHRFTFLILKPSEKRQSYCIHDIIAD